MKKIDVNTEVYMGNLTWPAFAERVKTARGVIIPIGSCEQHGHHLPLDTDNIIGTGYALELARRTKCLVTPTFNYGQVWSARNFPGTIALKPETITQILVEIIVSLERHGAKNIIMISGHNGNSYVIQRAARMARDEYDFRNVWFIPSDTPKAILDEVIETKQIAGKHHAAEMESSLVLALKPETVQMENAVAEYPDIPKAQKYRPVGWDEFLKVGVWGDPTKATAEKGRLVMEKKLDYLAGILEELIPAD